MQGDQAVMNDGEGKIKDRLGSPSPHLGGEVRRPPASGSVDLDYPPPAATDKDDDLALSVKHSGASKTGGEMCSGARAAETGYKTGVSANSRSLGAPSSSYASLRQVRFEVEMVEKLAADNNWNDLETYLVGFLSDVQSGSENPQSHPGLLFALYEANISDLIKEGKADDALVIFKEKVEPICSEEDTLFWPVDLKLCIEKLHICIKTRSLPLVKESICSSITNYIQLYFPETMRHTDHIYGRDTVLCFVKPFIGRLKDTEVQKYSCLACNWHLDGTSTPSVLITQHIKDQSTHRRCPCLTRYMIKLLATIEDREELNFKCIDADYVLHPASSKLLQSPDVSTSSHESKSGTSKRKGKSGAESLAESNELFEPASKVKKLSIAPVLVDPKPGMSILNSIQSGNLSIATKAATLGSEAGSVLEDLFFGQQEAISDLVTMFISSRKSGVFLNGHDVFLKIDSLLSVLRDAYPLLTVLPGDISKLVLEQDQSILKLRHSFLNAAAVAVSDHSLAQPAEVSHSAAMPADNASQLSGVLDKSSQQPAEVSNTVVSETDGN